MQDEFWISVDGTVLSQHETATATVELIIQFPFRNDREKSELPNLLPKLQFSERSRLARIGIELFLTGEIQIEKETIVAKAKAFVIDKEFPSFHYLPQLLRQGIEVGRLFHFPEKAKLNSEEIWEAIRDNRLKLPNTLSIDRFGQVHFTPHRRVYKLPPTVSETDLIQLVTGKRSRTYLDKLQTAHIVKNLSILPGAGLLSSCSMYLPHHYAVLHREHDSFGLHTGAVLLDPVKTFGSNIMLEIYNSSKQIVVNPLLSIDLFAAPTTDRQAKQVSFSRSSSLQKITDALIRPTTDSPTKPNGAERPADPANHENPSFLISSFNFSEKIARDDENEAPASTIKKALANPRSENDTLVTSFFPNRSETAEIRAYLGKEQLHRLIFHRASQNDPFYLPDQAQDHLKFYKKNTIEVYWKCAELNGIYTHTRKGNSNFFIREEIRQSFQISPLLAFYGSKFEEPRLRELIEALTRFFGSSLAILTGGDPESLAAVTAAGADSDILTGACFLELETNHSPAGPIDFFNSFQETGSQHQQNCFEAADFCIFSPGGTGTLEAAGRELSNLTRGIRPRIPFVFFSDHYWDHFQAQIETLLINRFAPSWIRDYLLFTSDPNEIVEFYRKSLQVL